MVENLRVVDLARTMSITPTELIFKLRSIGVSVSSEEDTLDLGTVRAIITGETLQKRPREVIVRTDTQEEETPTSTARDRLVRRRRRIIKTEREIKEVEATKSEADGEAPAPETEASAEAVESPDLEGAVVEDVEAVAEAEVEAEVETEAEAEAEVVEAADEAETVDEGDAEIETEVEADAAELEETTEEAADTAVKETAEQSTAEGTETEEEVELKPAPEVSEEELTAERRTTEEEPRRVRRKRSAKTPLEQGLRELSQDEIKARLKEQKEAAKRQKTAARGKKAKAAADAREIEDLLAKFEEQKLKGQQEGTPVKRKAPVRPAGPVRRGRSKRRRREDAPSAPPRPQARLQFKDGDAPEGPIILSEMVTAKELSDKLNVTVKDLLALLISKGVMVTANQSLPHELAEEICEEVGVEAMVASVEEVLDFEREEAAEDVGPLEPRPPVVTVMGHVDHGKTSLLDAIRSSRVAEQEAGGITQHIGASRITAPDGRVVVFIDTPGHEAFTQMRARGAQVTDLVVLVVAADDGVMPQTIEAINHSRAAGVQMVVAINKIDKANANPDRVKQALAEREVLVEDWGGDVPSVAVSAKKGTGIEDLLDMILLVAEMKELKASKEGAARGVVLEARRERGRGTVATALIQQGTLHAGDYFFCGSTWGRVRAMTDDQGQRVDEAGPSDPVEVMGFEDVPKAGDLLQVVEGEARAREVAEYRSQKEKEESLVGPRKASLENLFEQLAEGETKELSIVVKADVQGSVEVLNDTLEQLSTDKVKINVLHGSVGAVSTNDIMLASASDAIVIGFNVRPERTARELADQEKVDVRLYTVIYDLIDDIKKAMVGLLEPVFREEELGQAEVREVFRVPKIGAVAGCHVTSGLIPRNAKVRLLRDHVVVHEGTISSLKRFKDDASEVRQGFECGIGLDRFQDVKVGDVIEAYRMVEVEPEL